MLLSLPIINVPIILISGDEVTIQEAQHIAPKAEKVVVKQSIGRFAAAHIHPTLACEMLQRGASRAVRNLKGYASSSVHETCFARSDFSCCRYGRNGTLGTRSRTSWAKDQLQFKAKICLISIGCLSLLSR